ncbi:Rap1a/Tai family immunity protein [Phyllobacterium bourgognense]|nr:Rap1a/Tai family immunity protein [Phyllobacterium bourgognense]
MVAASVLPARADGFYDGNKLLKLCRSKDFDERGVCTGYVVAAADAWASYRIVNGKPTCLRPSVTVGQVQDVVVKFLEDNPGNRDINASTIAIRALYLAFCKQD